MIGKVTTSLESSEALREATEEFWTNLTEGVVESIEIGDSPTNRGLIDRVVHFVKCLVYPDVTIKSKSEGRVKFATGKQTAEQQTVQYSGDKEELSSLAKVFVENITLKSFSMAYQKHSPDHLHLFAALIELQPSDVTIQKVIQLCKGEKQGDQSNSSYFVFEICVPWLEESQSSEERKFDPEELVAVICTFVALLEREAVTSLLIKLTQVC